MTLWTLLPEGGGIQREKKLVLIICIVSFDHLFEADPKSWTICTIQDKDGIAYLLKSRVCSRNTLTARQNRNSGTQWSLGSCEPWIQWEQFEFNWDIGAVGHTQVPSCVGRKLFLSVCCEELKRTGKKRTGNSLYGIRFVKRIGCPLEKILCVMVVGGFTKLASSQHKPDNFCRGAAVIRVSVLQQTKPKLNEAYRQNKTAQWIRGGGPSFAGQS